MIDAALGIFELLTALAVMALAGSAAAVLLSAALVALAVVTTRIKQGARNK
ncbi:hypothetical protein GALAXY_39 [Arthrobacter phage Galaxy]|uniref:Uncharacterized protein n=1 Tax=Arthrobacter phage Galaxy TaxID=1772326 RepID=A0A0U4K735_9CAUD|nr:hypothetical protein FDG93_gp39 [Arthrobacter phage Galaxy]ALY08883.1 hypothetical protein GALAXY_39 [Arthrobacter phage Galaxy]